MSDDADRADSGEAPQDFLSAAWRRIKDHRIAQWTAGYIAVAYGIQHAVTLTSDAFKWPDAVIRISMLLLILSVPLAMVFAWYHGESPTRRASGPELTIISLLLVAVSILFFVFVRPASEVVSVPKTATAEAGVTDARQASLSPSTGISLAVMPFENLSPDPDQGYFADGMGEEITTALAKIPDLRVVGRESAQRFKGKNEDFRNIGRALNATHLLEGSVRKAGERLRITTQLVRADSGVTVWANAYDRQLTDVFAIQEDIARAIATSLHMMLGLKPGEDLVNQRTRNAALHDEYLRARNLVRMGEMNDAIKLLSDFVMREPDYAPAWAELAIAYHEKLLGNRDLGIGAVAKVLPVIRDGIAKRNAAAAQALKLDPDNAQANCVASNSRLDLGDVIAGMDLKQRGLALDPDEPDCLENYGNWLVNLGYPDKGVEVMQHLFAVEPLLPGSRNNLAKDLFYAGQTEAALRLFEQYFPKGNGFLPLVYAAQGQVQRAADFLASFKPPGETPPQANARAAAIRFLRAAPAAAPPDAPELGYYDWVYVYVGAPERLMGIFEAHLKVGFAAGPHNGAEWLPTYASVRKTERFKAWIRESGILTYWRARGWPPQCHPTTGDDFECS
jgi:adenylate cyclase